MLAFWGCRAWAASGCPAVDYTANPGPSSGWNQNSSALGLHFYLPLGSDTNIQFLVEIFTPLQRHGKCLWGTPHSNLCALPGFLEKWKDRNVVTSRNRRICFRVRQWSIRTGLADLAHVWLWSLTQNSQWPSHFLCTKNCSCYKECWLSKTQCDVEPRAQCLKSGSTRKESQLAHSLCYVALPLVHLIASAPQVAVRGDWGNRQAALRIGSHWMPARLYMYRKDGSWGLIIEFINQTKTFWRVKGKKGGALKKCTRQPQAYCSTEPADQDVWSLQL